MLIGTAVIGAVVEMVSPRLAAVSRLEVADHNLVKQLQNVKLRAISEDRCYQVRFSRSARTFQLASKRAVVPCGTMGFASDGEPRTIDKEDAIAVDASNDPVFDTWGNAPTTAMIKLSTANGSFHIISVNSEGRINDR
jgi:hypothetical protein